jgi:hypothetical protein
MKASNLRRMTATDVAAHQQRSFGAPRCTCKPVGAYHSPQCPVSLFVQAQLDPEKKGKRRGGKLRKHREPNETEREAGQILEAQRRRGEIVSAEFEAITLRWGDMEYTPDYFVIASQSWAENIRTPSDSALPELVSDMKRPLVEIVYVEIKGGWKWEDSVVKFKAFRKAMPWAQFVFWEKIDGRWNQAA